jgi:hypothetical protein
MRGILLAGGLAFHAIHLVKRRPTLAAHDIKAYIRRIDRP